MAEADEKQLDTSGNWDCGKATKQKRRLPEWMKNVVLDKDHTDSKKKRRDQQKTTLVSDLPVLKFTGNIVYCYQKDDCSFMCEDIMTTSSTADYSCVLGFDIEWPVTYTVGKEEKTALLQLCTSHNKCYLFHLSCMPGFPGGLKKLLETESIKKVGVGIQGDVRKLLRDFDVNMKGGMDLSSLANQNTRSAEIWSLDNLCKYVLDVLDVLPDSV
ncbi:Werner syndrome ATP-dependent helicase homolog [Branchiostoma floridae]|uniref:3'-5' exonuclease n=1 Tax=Branchiostoma floridae TaxID=7739 RepID=A0A9J7HHP0_BRAFL|nr:Werner syndrome ATP-dependent helicase homolog [Branchiostoma floridae]